MSSRREIQSRSKMATLSFLIATLLVIETEIFDVTLTNGLCPARDNMQEDDGNRDITRTIRSSRPKGVPQNPTQAEIGALGPIASRSPPTTSRARTGHDIIVMN
jgi:hypothetical protein